MGYKPYRIKIINHDLLALKNFGISQLNVSDAAKLVAKVLFLEGRIEADVPELSEDESYTIYHKSLDTPLAKDINKFEKMFVAAIEKGTLKTALILRNSDEEIIKEDTYLNMDEVEEWLAERSIDLDGDWMTQYWLDESEISEYAVQAIEIRRKIKEENLEYKELNPDKEIASLQLEVENLLREKMQAWEESDSKGDIKELNKPAYTRERQTLIKMVVGMAVEQYGYEPGATKNKATAQIVEDMDNCGLSISQDTVRKWLKEGAQFLPEIES